MASCFPEHTTRALADHHREFWEWFWAIEPGEASDPYAIVWDRGGGKSTCAEGSVVAGAARRKRKFCLYVSCTQDTANGHLRDVRARFESPVFGANYARISERKITKYGFSSSWTQAEIHTADGFAATAVGLDKAVRGIKYIAQRPDYIVLDDIDELGDTEVTTQKKIDVISRTILPAGSDDCVVLFVQNLILKDGVAAKLISDKPPFLLDRTVSGPIPAVWDAEVDDERQVVTGGRPSWKTLEEVNADIRRDGLEAWLAECQHEVGLRLKEGLVYGEGTFDPRVNVTEAPVAHPRQYRWRVAAYDPGGIDPSALVMVGVTDPMIAGPQLSSAPPSTVTRRRYHVYRVHRERGAVGDTAAHRVLQPWHQEAPIDRVVKDGEPSDLVRLHWPAFKADKSRAELAWVQELFRTGQLTIDPEVWPDVEREIGSYWWEDRADQTRSSRVDWATKTSSDHHADVLDAIRYAVVAVKHGLPGARLPAGQVGSRNGPRLVQLGAGGGPRPTTLRERMGAR